jgi:hypothetical protein
MNKKQKLELTWIGKEHRTSPPPGFRPLRLIWRR